MEHPGINDMDAVGKNKGDVLDAVVDLAARQCYGHEVAVEEAHQVAVAAALVLQKLSKVLKVGLP
eukprot:1813395-Rhodomonas_salina.1